MNEKRKKFVKAGAIVAIMVSALVVAGYATMMKKEKWHVVDVLTPKIIALGENTLTGDECGWLSTFLLDYDQTPGTVLAVNATDWSVNATAQGYIDADNQDMDIENNRPAYVVVRCRFNESVKVGSDFIGSRCRCTLTMSGDETISGVTQYGDINDTTGGGVVSQNGTSYIYINFYWDDNDDGYRILPDGNLDWSLVIEAKY